MTIIVGILCSDGVVMASDSAVTFGDAGGATVEQLGMQKVHLLGGQLLYSSTGAVGISQLIADKIETNWKSRAYSGVKTAPAMMSRLGQEINALVLPYLQTAQMQRNVTGDASQSLCKSMLAVPVNHKPFLFSFDFNGAPEMSTTGTPWVAFGSGQRIADPFLAFLRRILFPESEPTVAVGRLAAIWAISHVRRINTGGVGGKIQVATMVSDGSGQPSVSVMDETDIQEHEQRVGSAEQVLHHEIASREDGEESEPPSLPSS